MGKIICIGAHKTGTGSLNEMMKMLGYKRNPHGLWFGNAKYRRAVEGGDYRGVVNSLGSGNWFVDSPYNHDDVYKALDLPNVRFIFTTREPQEWFDSFLRWAKVWPIITEPTFRADIFYGGLLIEKNRDIVIDSFNRRNDGIIDYFKGDIFTIDVSDTDETKKQKLSNFLGKPITGKYPHENKTL